MMDIKYCVLIRQGSSGGCSDGVPLFGYRRRSYLVLCGLVGAVSWLALATVVDSQYSATAMILLGSLSFAFSDVVSAAA
jgi:hypothetical protein